MHTIKKYSMTVSNRMFAMVLVLVFLYIVTMYLLTVTHTLPCSLSPSHDSDSHVDLHATDEIIIILGYKLHPDGMATRVLRDRVERAANLYKSLMEMRHHPLIIVSGKGKSEIGYTEAQVMMEWCTLMGVRQNDILVDPESTNTVQNAKFSAELIKNKTDIHQVYVVTSDYHILRAQYIFQTVFPTNVRLDFVSSLTPANKFAETVQKERFLMGSSRDDLLNEKLLERNDYGLHSESQYPLWQMVSREMDNDVRDGVTEYDDESVTVADYTRSQKYFSTLTAVKFPLGRVLHIEDQLTSGDSGTEQQPANIYYCPIPTTNATLFAQLQRLGLVYTYQLCFTMFDWFPSNATREEFEGILASLLTNARTSFLEFPEAMMYKGREGQQNWELLNRWYDGRNETQILADVARTHSFQVQPKLLGPTLHDHNTIHKLLRVDVVGNTPRFSQNDFLAAYKCSLLDASSTTTTPSAKP